MFKLKDTLELALNRNIEAIIDFTPKLILALIFLIAFFYLEKLVNILILKVTNRSRPSKVYSKILSRLSKILFIFIGIIIFLRILGFENLATGIFAGGGLTTLILGLAFKEIGENFLAGVLLSLNRPFRIGDFIRTVDVEGIVKSIEIRYTHIKTIDGKDIYIPSSKIYRNILTNYTKDGFIRYSFDIGVDYSSNLYQVCDIIESSLKKIPGILEEPASGCIVNNLLPTYIEIKAFFWIDMTKDKTEKEIRKEVASLIKDELINNKIILSNNVSSNLDININKVAKSN